jgi:hypothetical protein
MKKEIEKFLEIDKEEFFVKISADFSESTESVSSEFWGSPCTEYITSLKYSGYWDFELLDPEDESEREKVYDYIERNIDEIIEELKEC